MLELRPSCERCAQALPPASTDAMICSFECTFCKTCVDQVLHGICPNCGGNFVLRPVRSAQKRKNEGYLGKYPAGLRTVQKQLDIESHAVLVAELKDIAPEDR